MTKAVLLTVIGCLLWSFSPRDIAAADPHVDPRRMLRQLVPELPDIQMPLPEDLEPNPEGKYRRHAVIQGDFNKDGRQDIAICAVDPVNSKARLRDSYVLIASKTNNDTWDRVFFERIPGVVHPFLIWDAENMALLVGANYSDYNPGDIIWDSKTKEFKLVEPRNK